MQPGVSARRHRCVGQGCDLHLQERQVGTAEGRGRRNLFPLGLPGLVSPRAPLLVAEGRGPFRLPAERLQGAHEGGVRRQGYPRPLIDHSGRAREKKTLPDQGALAFKWRRSRDSNPRCPCGAYSLSRRAPSASRSLLRVSSYLTRAARFLQRHIRHFRKDCPSRRPYGCGKGRLGGKAPLAAAVFGTLRTEH